MSLQLKVGVKTEGVQPQIWFALGYVARVFKERGLGQLVVTSLRDQHEHKPKSLHNTGFGLDFRTRHLSDAQRQELTALLRAVFDPTYGFDTVDEGNHIHIEFDPKPGEKFQIEGVS